MASAEPTSRRLRLSFALDGSHMRTDQIEELLKVGYGSFAFGALVTGVNFHLSFIRPVLYRLRGRECPHVSGFPLLGSAFLVVSFFMLPSGEALRPLALLVALFDTGGLHWFFGVQLYHWCRSHRAAQREKHNDV